MAYGVKNVDHDVDGCGNGTAVILDRQYSSRWLIATGLVTAFSAWLLYLLPGISLDGYSLACLGVFTVVLATGMTISIRYMNSL